MKLLMSCDRVCEFLSMKVTLSSYAFSACDLSRIVGQ
jgi:hypothetical protein